MITSGISKQYYQDLFDTLAGHSLYLALYGPTASLSKTTLVYTTAGELVNANYTAGGKPLTGLTVVDAGIELRLTCSPVVWNPGAFTVSGGMVYDATDGNKVLLIIATGVRNTLTPTNVNFNVALLRAPIVDF